MSLELLSERPLGGLSHSDVEGKADPHQGADGLEPAGSGPTGTEQSSCPGCALRASTQTHHDLAVVTEQGGFKEAVEPPRKRHLQLMFLWSSGNF